MGDILSITWNYCDYLQKLAHYGFTDLYVSKNYYF